MKIITTALSLLMVVVGLAAAEDTGTANDTSTGDTGIAEDTSITEDTGIAEDTSTTEDTGIAEDTSITEDTGTAGIKLIYYRSWKFDYKRDIVGVEKLDVDSLPQTKHCLFVWSEGKLNELKQYGSGQKLVKIHTYTYDERDLKKAITSTDVEGNIIQYGRIVNDDQGRRLKESYFTPEKKLIIEYKYIYDEEGKLIEIAGYSFSGKLRKKNQIAYNGAGNPSEIKYIKGDNIEKIEKIGYDQQQREIFRTVLDKYLNTISSSRYRYDQNGNRISVISDKSIFSEEEQAYRDRQRKRGLVPFDGGWVTPAERDRQLRRRARLPNETVYGESTGKYGMGAGPKAPPPKERKALPLPPGASSSKSAAPLPPLAP